jgi:hypothetical protein
MKNLENVIDNYKLLIATILLIIIPACTIIFISNSKDVKINTNKEYNKDFKIDSLNVLNNNSNKIKTKK